MKLLFFIILTSYSSLIFGNSLAYKSPFELTLILEAMPKNESYYSLVTKLEETASLVSIENFIEISRLEIYKTLITVDTDSLNYKNELNFFNSESKNNLELKFKTLKNPFLKWIFQSIILDYKTIVGSKSVDDLNIQVKSNSNLDPKSKKLLKKIIILNYWYKKLNLTTKENFEIELINQLAPMLLNVLQNIENGLEIFVRFSPKKNNIPETIPNLPSPKSLKWDEE